MTYRLRHPVPVRILLILSVLLVMAVIFSFSAEDGTASHATSSDITDLFIRFLRSDYDSLSRVQRIAFHTDVEGFLRKLGHFCEYALLGCLMGLMFRSFYLKRWFLFGWAGSTLYAGTDELHQMFTGGGRAALFSDVVLDSLGAAFGLLWAMIFVRLFLTWIRRRSLSI